MIRTFFYIVLFIGLTIISCSQKQELNDETVAIVGNRAISFSDFKTRYNSFLDATTLEDNLRNRTHVADNMVNELLLYHHDANQAIYDNPDFNKEIEWFKNQMILGYLKDSEIYANIKVTDTEIREAFVRVNEKIAARHLYAKTEGEAYSLLDELNNGQSFDNLAKNVFSDSVLKNSGGYIGYFTWGDMDPAFEDAAYNLGIGEISDPVKTRQGYSIIKVEDRKPNPLLTESEFLNKKAHMERVLKIAKKKDYEKEYLNKISKDMKLVFNDECIDELAKKYSGRVWDKKDEIPIKMSTGVCVEYNGEKLSGNDIEKLISTVPRFHMERIKSSQNVKETINGLFLKDKLLKIAHSKGYDTAPKVVDAIKTTKNNLFLKYKRKEILNKVVIPDSVARMYYDENKDKYKSSPMISIQEIIVDGYDLALKIKGDLMAGADFSGLAKQYSLRRSTAENGGKIGYAEINRFGMLKTKLWQTKELEILGPVEMNGLYGIFKIIGKKESQVIPYPELKTFVIDEYKKANETELVKAYLKNLKSSVDVSVNRLQLKQFHN